MKKFIATFALAALAMIVFVGTSLGAPANLKPFADPGSSVTVQSSTSATIVNDNAGTDGGVYVQGKSLNGKLLGTVSFGFTSTGTVGGGAPRFSIPINDSSAYAFMDAANCGGTSGQSTLVSTTNPSCKVFYGSESYANWNAFAQAHPTYKIGSKIPFIIADGNAGTFSLTGIDLH
jgi:hypothetical protein